MKYEDRERCEVPGCEERVWRGKHKWRYSTVCWVHKNVARDPEVIEAMRNIERRKNAV